MWTMYKTIWRATGKRQIILILLALFIAFMAAVPLEFQKRIVNGLEGPDINAEELGWLCGLMLLATIVSLTAKWLLGYCSSVLGEDVIRQIRVALYERSADPANPKHIEAGTLATSISAEAEELGKFTGGAISEPVVQVGTLLSVIGFIASTQPGLGIVAIGIILPQIVIVLMTQRKVNELVATRVRLLRAATNQIVSADLLQVEQEVLAEFDAIYETRRSMFRWKLSTKFLLSMLNSGGTVLILFLGGLYVLRGESDVGTVVAATIGLGRLQAPTSFLIAFYRQVSATRVKFDLLVDLGLTAESTVRAGSR